MNWAPLQKKRMYYKATLETPIVVPLDPPARQSHYEPEVYMLDADAYHHIRDIEKQLVLEVAKANERWFQNCLTVKQVQKRFTSACEGSCSITLERPGKETCSAVELRGARIFKNHWTPIWCAVAPRRGEEMEIDKADGPDHRDLEEVCQQLGDYVHEVQKEIESTKDQLTLFSAELGGLYKKLVSESASGDMQEWQVKVDQIYQKIRLYRSGIVLTATGGAASEKPE